MQNEVRSMARAFALRHFQTTFNHIFEAWRLITLFVMATSDKLVRKSSFEDFYYADIVDSSKSNAAKFLSLQFEKMRENLASAGINPQISSAPSSATKGVKFQASSSTFDSPMHTPMCALESANSPGNHLPKPILIISSPAATSSKIYSKPNSPARSRLPSAEKIKVATPQDKPPSPPPKDMGVNPVVSLPDRPELIRTLGSPKSSFRSDDGTIAALNTFRGVKKVNSGSFRDEVHLHHDVFLATQNDSIAKAVEAISRRRQEVISRYPQTSEINYNLKPETKNVSCIVPSHVVARSPSAERSRSVPRSSSANSLRGGIASATQSTERPRSATPNSTTIRTMSGTSVKIPVLALTSEGVQSDTPNAPLTAHNLRLHRSASEMNVKSVVLNPAMYRPAKSFVTGVDAGSTNSLSHLRISPTTVIEAGEQPKNASPTIKQNRKKFDFGGAAPMSVSPTQTSQTQLQLQAQGLVTPHKGKDQKGLIASASKSNVKATSSTTTPRTPAISSASVSSASKSNTPNKSTPYSHTKPTSKITSTTNTTNKTSTTTPGSAHRTPDKPSPSALSTQSSASKNTLRSASRGHYRPLTAAEISAAEALTAKLNAANAAYNRAESANVQPVRSMSRALSQLVYNVRDN